MRSILLRCPVLHDLPREPSEELKLVVTQQHVELDVKRCWYFAFVKLTTLFFCSMLRGVIVSASDAAPQHAQHKAVGRAALVPSQA